ncbi:MAG: sugar kinase [Micromonosporaceae bacterium]
MSPSITPGAPNPPGGLVTLGETMGLLVAAGTGPLATAGSMRLRIGGAESNVAIGARRLGCPATWIGRIGPDSVGELVLRELRAEGVTCVAPVDTAATGLMLRHRRTADLTRVDYHRAGSAGSRLGPEDLPADLIAAAKVLHLTGITPALGPGPAAAVHAAIEIARKAGALVSLDVNYRAALWSRSRAGDTLRDLLGSVDVVFAGVDEARLLVAGGTPREQTQRLVASGPTQAVIKLGEAGCHALIDGVAYDTPAIPVRVVDPVGAGDAFVAGYLADLIQGASPSQRLATATAAGAFTVATHGDWEGMPRREELSLLQHGDDVVR